MKNRLIILLAVGVIGVIANPVSKQTIISDNKNPPQTESIESLTKHEESALNNGNEQKKEETIVITEPPVSDDRKYDDKVDIIIEETVVSPVDDTPNLIDETPIPIDVVPQMPYGFEDDFPVNDIPFREAQLNTIPGEIMETAAGFIPTPLVFRRKQNSRRRFANRRHFRPNPFRRKFNFYYPYYGFYRPSSLRFY